jgi:O-antigen/teichoic acid export membrane protein
MSSFASGLLIAHVRSVSNNGEGDDRQLLELCRRGWNAKRQMLRPVDRRHPPTAPSLQHMLKRVVGSGWSAARTDSGVLFITTVGTSLARLLSTIILTRLLAPDVFGMVSIIIALFFAIIMITDLGFQGFVVRHEQGDDDKFLDVVWTVHVVRSLAIAVLIIASAEPVSSFLEKPQLHLPFAVASLTFVSTAFESLAPISALRRREVKKLCWIDLFLTVSQVGLGIILSIFLRNVWALVIAMIFHSVAKTAISYVWFPRPGRRFSIQPKIIKELGYFSKFIIPSSTITFLVTQSDKLVLAKMLSLQQIGMYAIAVSIAQVPAMFAAMYGSRLLYPLYSEAWRADAGSIRGVYYSARRTVSCLYALGAGLISGAAPLIIAIVYDARYQGAAVYLMILAAGGIFAVGNQAANQILTASGRFGATLAANIIRLAWLVLAGTLGVLAAGPIGLVIAVGSIELLPYLYNLGRLRRAGLLDVREELLQVFLGLAGIAAGWLSAAIGFKLLPLAA